MSWHIEWIEGGADAADSALATRWDAAFEAYGDIWQGRQFASSWERIIAVAEGCKPYLIYAIDNANHEILYLLYAREARLSGLMRTVIEPAGGLFGFDYQDPLSLGEAMHAKDWDAYWSALYQSAKAVFPKLGQLAAYRLFETHSGTIADPEKPDSIAPYLPFEPGQTLEHVLQNCGSSHRGNVRRRLRQAENLGPVSLEMITGTEVTGALEQMFVTYENQWGTDGRPHCFQNLNMQIFFKDLANIAQQLGKLHFSRLMVGNEIWHWHFGFVHRGSLLWLKPTYATQVQKHSPGLVHLALLIEYCLDNDLHEIDFGYGSEPYKFLWTNRSRSLYSRKFMGTNALFMLATRVSHYRRTLNQSSLANYVKWKWNNWRKDNDAK